MTMFRLRRTLFRSKVDERVPQTQKINLRIVGQTEFGRIMQRLTRTSAYVQSHSAKILGIRAIVLHPLRRYPPSGR